MSERTAAQGSGGALRRLLAARGAGPDAGMTLIEVVIAAVLLGILSTAVLGVILQTQATEVGNRARISATNLAAREIDMVREEFLRSDTAPVDIATAGTVTNPHPLDGGTAGQPLVVDGVAYTVVRSVQWNITGDGRSACEGGALVAYPTLGVTVEVTWPNMGGIRPVVSQAAFAPEKGTGIPTTASFVAVSVVDSAGEPNVGRSVTVSSSGYTRTGTTDVSGCAVVQVEPASGAGTNYTVSLGDAGYVDINGSQNPSKPTGLLAQGQLNNAVGFAYDRAGTVEIVMADPSGSPLSDADVAGSQVTLVASEFSGASGERAYTVTGVRTTVTGLWPTQYGAYSGTTAPAEYPTVDLEPGASIELQVPFEFAMTSALGMPSGTTSVIAVPSAAGNTCSTPGARTVSAGNVRLLPGSWDFFAVGSGFSCSPGPSAVSLVPGVNDDVAWGTTTLRVTGAPAGHLWALERGQVSGALTTCPGAAATAAVDAEAARSGDQVLPAGDWYLYVTSGAANGPCVSFPTSYNPRTVAYGVGNTLAWPAPPTVTVTITGVPLLPSSSTRATLVASTSNALTCTTTTTTPSTGVQNLGNGGSTISTTALGAGTWYIYGWDKRSSGNWTPRCRLAAIVTVGWNNLTVPYTYPNPTPTGP